MTRRSRAASNSRRVTSTVRAVTGGRRAGRAFRRDDLRQRREELAHPRVERALDLRERRAQLVGQRPAGQAFDDRAAEVQRGDVGDRQPFLHGAKRDAVEPPALGLVFFAFVVEREAGFLQRLQVAADRPRRDLHLRRQLVNRDRRSRRCSISRRICHCRMTSAFRIRGPAFVRWQGRGACRRGECRGVAVALNPCKQYDFVALGGRCGGL